MRTNLLLALFGSLIGAACVSMLLFFVPSLTNRLATGQGSSFESLESLRASMAQRKESEQSTEKEVPLRGIVIPHPSDSIIYELEPNRTAQFRHQIVRMNSHGMRSPEVPLKKPAGTFRIAVLGDSYTFGWGVEQEKVFTRWMETELAKSAPRGTQVEVLNFGVPGYATFQEVAAFLEKGVQFEPDAVLVYVISNDFGLPFFIKDINGGNSLSPAPAFHQQHIAATDTEALAKRAALLKSLDANYSLVELALYCKKHQLPLFLAVHPDKSAKTTKARLWSLRQEPSKGLITVLKIGPDYRRIISEENIPEETLSIPRDHHPGPGAHEAIGKALGRQISMRLWSATAPQTAP